MVRYIIRRLLQMVVTFFGTTFIVYALMFANQDDPIQALAGDRPVSDDVRQAADRAVPPRRPVPGAVRLLHAAACSPATSGRRSPAGRSPTSWPTPGPSRSSWPLLALVFAIDRSASPPAWSPGMRRGSVFDNTTLVAHPGRRRHPDLRARPRSPSSSSASSSAGSRPPPAPSPSLYALLLPALVLGALSLATDAAADPRPRSPRTCAPTTCAPPGPRACPAAGWSACTCCATR